MEKIRSGEENIQKTKTEYQNPNLNCDVVMKGGITSGVVYPLALCELAKTYRFRNIGGASAGAIGAVAAAAAEYGRTENGTSYAELEQLPKWFGEKPEGSKNSNLYHLFQPQKSTRKIFNILISGILHNGSLFYTALFIILVGAKEYPILTFIGALPGIVLIILTAKSTSGLSAFYCILMSILLTLIGIGSAIGFKIRRELSNSIPDNFYGMCRGRTERNTEGPQALSNWLSDLIDRIAGVDEGDKPLTFGDLKKKDINLMTITTNLTNGIPHTIPFINNIYYFDPQELRTIFPDKVVKWMEQNPRDYSMSTFGQKFKDMGLVPLPDAENLPIVFAARLSLSFPILLSMVPLYAIDLTREKDKDKVPEKCWFSDGGICSNFPIHFFDKPIPAWPTFAINLKEFHPDHPKDADDKKNIWMPRTNIGGILASWHRFDQMKGNKMFSFVGAIKNAMMNWRDTKQMSIPGYRDRIVHVSVSDEEGGLNLNMPPAIIDSLGNRGKFAGRKLVEVYTNDKPKPGQLSWDNHRWVRFRSTMPLVIDNLVNLYLKLKELKDTKGAGNKTYEDLMNDPPSYPWNSDEQKAYAVKTTSQLIKLVKEWDLDENYNLTIDLDIDAPRPEPEYRIMPKI